MPDRQAGLGMHVKAVSTSDCWSTLAAVCGDGRQVKRKHEMLRRELTNAKGQLGMHRIAVITGDYYREEQSHGT